MATLSLVRSAPASAITSYAQLRSKLRETLLEGQRKIEREKVLTYWQTGKHLHEHIFPQEGRAKHYGQEVIEKLAQDLQISDSVLYQCLQAYRAFKNLYARTNSFDLTWAHLRAAMRIPDEKKRMALIEQAAKEKWTSRDLEIKVRNLNWDQRIADSEGKAPAKLPFVCLGPFYHYRIIQPETIHSHSRELLIDLGFSYLEELRLFSDKKIPPGTLVTSSKDARGRYSLEKVFTPSSVPGSPDDLLYTFKAYVERVIDGDTLKVEFELGLGNWHPETIRLNHIDCPEMNTPEGKAAKKFVEAQLSGCDFITVKSVQTKREKWGRYLGEVFFQKKGASLPVYLNQLLLDKGHAVRIRR